MRNEGQVAPVTVKLTSNTWMWEQTAALTVTLGAAEAQPGRHVCWLAERARGWNLTLSIEHQKEGV